MNRDPIIHSLYAQPNTAAQPPSLHEVPIVLGAVGVGTTVLEKVAKPMPDLITGANQSGSTVDYSGMTGGKSGDKTDDILRDE